MRMIDMHCDTLWKLIDLDGQGDLMKNDCHISIPSMKKAGTVVQLFACFTQAADYKKKGGYDAYLIPEGIEDYSYIKDGKEMKGSQYRFKMEFPKKSSEVKRR